MKKYYRFCHMLCFSVGGLLAVGLTFTACTLESEPASVMHAETLKPTSPPLAVVNGSAITEEQLSLAVERSIGKNPYQTEEMELKILQSLVSSRAIAQRAEKEMNAQELTKLALKVQAYREELLVQSYLQKNVPSEPITAAMIKAYYDENPQRFAGGVIKEFEYLHVLLQQGEDPANYAAALGEIAKSPDWKEQLDHPTLNHQGVHASHKKAELRVDLIQEPIKRLVSATAAGQVAPLSYDNNTYILLRVINERSLPVKPLTEVSGEIRKILAARQLKSAVRSVSETMRQSAQIEYIAK